MLIGFEMPRPARAADPVPVSPFRSWIRIDQNGAVTLLSGRSEMGQGISSALPMVLADELGVDWKDVRVEQAPNDTALFGDQGTGGSGSVTGSWLPIRQAAAAARSMFVTAAAQQWNVSPADCSVASGAVISGNKRLSFGELVDSASKLPIPDFGKVALKNPKDFKIIGTVCPAQRHSFQDRWQRRVWY